MIYLQPSGGLCNRILAIDSGIALAMDIGQELTVLWERYPLLNCNYTDLFEANKIQFTLIERKQKNYFSRQIDKTINYLRFEKFIYVRSFKALRDANFDFKELRNHRSIYICGFNRFHGKSSLNNYFKPTNSLSKKINACTANFDKYTIGLHLRRTDHMDAINVSSTDKFVNGIEEELKRNEKANFFLSTDSREEAEKLKTLFGQKIIHNNSNLSRNNLPGVQDALVDLYCLANTSKIYGSYKSSFSETAAEIGNTKLIIVQ